MENSTTAATAAGAAKAAPEGNVFRVTLPSQPLSFSGHRDGESLGDWMSIGKENLPEGAESRNEDDAERKGHPFNVGRVKEFKRLNVHHSTCIETKKACTVGLGFLTEEDKLRRKTKEMPPPPPQVMGEDGKLVGEDPLQKLFEELEAVRDLPSRVDQVMDPLCRVSFQNVLNDVNEDYWAVGWGLMEIVRDDGGSPIGVHHAPVENYWIVKEGGAHWHWVNCSDDGEERRFARFGDADGLKARLAANEKEADGGENPSGDNADTIYSELIFFPRSTNLHRYYGYPDYLAAVRDIELKEALDQKTFDFFHNRGVPELLLLLTGGKVSDVNMTAIENCLKGTIGVGNAHKTVVANLPAEVQTEFHKLAMDSNADDEFGNMTTSLGLEIVSAHGTPPLLAGIQVPGKMGAVNELPNALLAYQTLKIGQAQKEFQAIFGKTLGNPEKNGGLGLVPQDFVFNTVLDRFDLGATDTMSRMRTPVTQAQSEGRSPKEGLKD